MSSNCIYCNSITSNAKFCSRSCAASYNNKGVRRHGAEPNKCMLCGDETRNEKYCSNKCSSKHRNISSDSRLSNRLRQARYRAKGLRKMHPTANNEKIREIYSNCPDGYEVDHIVPLSLGGLHHEDNLQYLTIKENRSKSNRYIG